jgi:hypothetical protein
MSAISPNLDAYGTYARVSAIADWLELCAWHGRRVNRAQLEDLVYDYGWVTKSPHQFTESSPVDTADSPGGGFFPDIPELWSEAVYSALQERQGTLGARWPFTIRGDWEVVPSPTLNSRSPYLALLCITVAHAWDLPTSIKPTSLVEATVARAMRSKGLSVVEMGTGDRAGMNFQANLEDTSARLGLRCMSPAVPAKLHAKDAGVDTMCMIGWQDGRAGGQWLSIGQVTITKSDRWEAKLQEPRPDNWAGYLLEPLPPIRFLAVPHHVERAHLAYLVGPATGAVVDRVRLTLDLTDTSAEERAMIGEVFSIPLDDGRSIV